MRRKSQCLRTSPSSRTPSSSTLHQPFINPPPSFSNEIHEDVQRTREDLEETVLVGRHPAYDIVPPFDLQASEEEKEEEIKKVDNSTSFKNEDKRFVHSVFKALECVFPNENSECFVQNEIPSAPPMPDDIKCLLSAGGNGG
ncbi:hypothetical protein Nepgr_023650 [Nepenthes gracilis]|uniref:Uncharacterized protein n=1 Tax=Nepenthes gracilis TaxID=150966 RepID=A0AAD3XXW6_NEPGR|nr:hypothetical protein Nepgr_023650 [Nepenthes gracilis]